MTRFSRQGDQGSEKGTGSWPPFTTVGNALWLAAILIVYVYATHLYNDQHSEIRRAETGRYLMEFRSPPLARARARIEAAWYNERERQQRFRSSLAALDGPTLEAELYHHQTFTLEVVEDYGLHADIAAMHSFYRRLALCIRAGHCDADIAARELGDNPWQFRDQHHYALIDAFPDEPLDSDLEVITPRQQDSHIDLAAEAGSESQQAYWHCRFKRDVVTPRVL